MSKGADVTIRLARSKDLDSLALLRKELLDHHARLDPYWETTDNWEGPLRVFMRAGLARPDHVLIVAETANGLVGYCMASVQKHSNARVVSEVGYIVDLMVTEQMRGHGVGTALFERAADWFKRKGLTRVELKVAVMNESSCKFWSKLGFQTFMELRSREL